MTDYKDTLNLPKTGFPMRGNLPVKEPKILAKWQEQAVYQQLRAANLGKPKFILHDGPPYANGNIHIGHVLNKTLKDIIVKSKALLGYDTPFTPGWDCHGLPIELNVEKKLGKAGAKVSYSSFRAYCREYAAKQISQQKQDFMRLGIIGDWEHPYMTMDFAAEGKIISSLAKLVEHGFISKGDKPVHWCFDCQSSLAEAEVEYHDKQSASLYVKFPVVDNAKLLEAFEVTDIAECFVAIWTTTPWSLTANQAVALHPEYTYSLVSTKDHGCLIMASDLVPTVMQVLGGSYQELGSSDAKSLELLELRHPFEPRTIPIILAEHVTLDAGTGAVHTAPSHGLDDYKVCLQYQLEVIKPVAANGCYHEDVAFFAGQHVFKATKAILSVLQQHGNLLHEDTLEHSYPHCWRHKTPVIYRATPQWFIELNNSGLRDDALSAIKECDWFPKWGSNRITAMVSGRPDWCISRQQRSWGVPMAFVLHEQTGELHPDIVKIMQDVAAVVSEKGIDAWFDLPLSSLTDIDITGYTKSFDTLDVWLCSGLSHQYVLAEHNLGNQADLYLEGSDQHRGWFQSSLLSAVALNRTPPYKAVLTHGYTVDGQGRKMSKSVGNVINPDKLIKQYGADVLRLWVAATDYQKDVHISEEILRRIADAYRRIRNTIRYLLANLSDFDPEYIIASEQLLGMDQFILFRTEQVQQEILQAYEGYQLHMIYHKIHNFCTVDLGGFYLDVIKDRQYTCQANSSARRSCQTTIYHIAHAMVRWLAPILSFTAEEMWEHLLGADTDTIFLNSFYQLPKVNLTQENIDLWQVIMEVRTLCNKELETARNAGVIGSGLDAHVTIKCPAKYFKYLDQLKKELHYIFIVSKVDIVMDNSIADNTNMHIEISKSPHPKCIRCWHRKEDIGLSVEHPEICSRCIANVYGDGEVREIA